MAASTDLKLEAKELGIPFSPNISEANLQAKIDEHYASIGEPVKVTEDTSVSEPVGSGSVGIVKSNTGQGKGKVRSMQDIIKQAKAEAKATRIVTIVDNDQRINNQTTTCTVNCSNEHFDLGTRVIPLNERVEVEQGFIDTLREVRIPQHTKDPKTGLSRTVVRPRYTISFG